MTKCLFFSPTNSTNRRSGRQDDSAMDPVSVSCCPPHVACCDIHPPSGVTYPNQRRVSHVPRTDNNTTSKHPAHTSEPDRTHVPAIQYDTRVQGGRWPQKQSPPYGPLKLHGATAVGDALLLIIPSPSKQVVRGQTSRKRFHGCIVKRIRNLCGNLWWAGSGYTRKTCMYVH